MVEKVEQRHLYGQEDREVPSDNEAGYKTVLSQVAFTIASCIAILATRVACNMSTIYGAGSIGKV